MMCKHTSCGGLKMRAPKARSPYGVGSGALERAPEAKRFLVFSHVCILSPLLLINYVIFVPSYCELPCKFCQSHFGNIRHWLVRRNDLREEKTRSPKWPLLISSRSRVDFFAFDIKP